MPTPSAPTEIRSVAVKTDELVQALELNQTSAKRVVLRVTPPFSGRMRARVHVVQEDNGVQENRDRKESGDVQKNNENEDVFQETADSHGDGNGESDETGNSPEKSQPAPIRIDPATFLSESCPSYPRPAETEDELRADPDVEYTVERHHDRHTAAVQEWRKRLPSAINNHIPIDVPEGTHEVEVVALGKTE